MNLKEKMKRFWTLNVHNREGFTLVELIIVIAILAILSSVAVVGYSSYVEKANKAADEALLYEINQAFMHACLENYLDSTDVNAWWDMENMTVKTVEEVDDATEAEILAAFEEFFEVTAPKFNVYKGLAYVKELGLFVEGIQTANGLIASSDAINKILAGTWLNAGLTSEDILNMVVDTADFAQELYAQIFSSVQNSPEFKESAAKALGMTVAEYEEYYNSLVQAKRAQGMTPPEARKAVNSEIAILVAAKNADDIDIMTILTTNGGADAKTQIKGQLEGTSTSTAGLSQAALAYGMYHAWIYSRTDLTAEQKEEKSAPGTALNDLNNPVFQAWLETPQAATDLEALKAALGVISGQDTDTTKDTVENGYDDPDLVEALKQLLGK